MNYLKYFKHRMTQLGLKGTLSANDLDELIKEAISLALDEVWNAGHWTFRHKLYSLDTSTAQDSYELPSDCGPVGTPKHEESNVGGALKYLPKAAFDRRFPKLTAFSDGYPQVWTVFDDEPNHKKYIQFMPRPSIAEVQVPYLTKTPKSADHIPNEARAALVAAIGVYLYKPDTMEYRAATYELEGKLRRLMRVDTPQGETPHQMFDASQLQVESGYPWA